MVKKFLNTDPASCEMQYVIDAQGEELLLKDGQFQVMMQWEKPYMQACIDALQPFGAVLEVGFGCGYSATHIQTYRPKSHTIIEYHPTVAERARQWAKDYQGVTIIEETWQNALGSLGVFDCIFFDDYPLEDPSYLQEIEQQSKSSCDFLEKGNALLAQVQSLLPHLNSLKYTYSDIQDLLFAQKNPNGLELYRFFNELKEREQITIELFEKLKQELIERGWLSLEQCHPAVKSCSKPNERLMQFLTPCLANHMRKGSRFSCFLSDPMATWENENFFQSIIAHPDFDYREEHIPITVPDHCTYYTAKTALVITVEKKI